MSLRWRWVLAVAILVIAAVAYAATPLLSLLRLKDALKARNPDAVQQWVDFPRLKANVKRAEHRKIDRSNSGSFLAPVKDAVTKTIADVKLDQLASPDGLIHLVCDAGPNGDIDTSVPHSAPCNIKGGLSGIGYESPDRFRATVQPDHGKPFDMILARDHGIHWNLVDLR